VATANGAVRGCLVDFQKARHLEYSTMKRPLSTVCALALALPALGQTERPIQETTTVTTTTTTVPPSSGFDLLGELWSMQDATPLPCGQVDLRLTGGWITSSAPANKGDSGDDFVITPSIVWGAADNLEVFANVPSWVGAGGEIPGDEGNQGNFDTYAGLLWRFADTDQGDWAFQATTRIPTGDQSSGVDVEGRRILTNEYASGLRSHFNFFTYSSNTSNVRNNRHLQCGAIVGLDGPLNGDGSVRWVLDYMNRTSTEYGHDNTNLLDAGFQWKIDECNNFGMSVQAGLDHANDEAPNFGAKVTYSYSLTY